MASETVGVFTREKYMPCYLVGFEMCLDAVKNCVRLLQSVFLSPIRGYRRGENRRRNACRR